MGAAGEGPPRLTIHHEEGMQMCVDDSGASVASARRAAADLPDMNTGTGPTKGTDAAAATDGAATDGGRATTPEPARGRTRKDVAK